MELAHLIEYLANVAAYLHPVEAVAIRQTRISVVVLAGSYVYKIKKPVKFGYLDFTVLESHRHFCEEEARLDRRLAPTVYLGVVPVTRTTTRVEFESQPEAIGMNVPIACETAANS